MAEETTMQERAEKLWPFGDAFAAKIAEEIEIAHSDGVRHGLEEACGEMCVYCEAEVPAILEPDGKWRHFENGEYSRAACLGRCHAAPIRARLAEGG